MTANSIESFNNELRKATRNRVQFTNDDSALKTGPDRVGADSLVSRLSNGNRICIGNFDMYKAIVPVEPDD